MKCLDCFMHPVMKKVMEQVNKKHSLHEKVGGIQDLKAIVV